MLAQTISETSTIRHNQRQLAPVMFAAALCVYSASSDADTYLGVSLLHSESELERGFGEDIKGNSLGYKVDLGYRIGQYFGVQFSYQDYGELESGPLIIEGGIEGPIGEDLTLESRSFSLSGIAKLPFNEYFSLELELGVEKWNVDYDVILDDLWGPPGYTFDASDSDFYWSIGASYNATDRWQAFLGFRAQEWDTKFNLDSLEKNTIFGGIRYWL